ncbi:MAG: hypothetical protein U0324_32860 [Polyangiales bacterium]
MTKAKGTKGSAKAVAASAKPAPKGTKPAAKAAPAKPAAKPTAPAKAAPAKPAAKAPPAKPAAKAPAAKPAPAASKPPAAASKPAPAAASKPPAAASAPPPAAAPAPTSEGLIIKKKKVKRGAPPMLPRRLPRRPLPPLEGSAPPPPKPTITGSLHAPARSPEGAEKLKANLTKAISALAKLKGLKRNLQRQFWDAALTLKELSDPALYQAKGYGSWESFLEREVEKELGIGRVQAVDLVRIVKVFNREAAEEFGQDKLRAALKALYPEPGGAPSGGETG